jgi:hypothetical protein
VKILSVDIGKIRTIPSPPYNNIRKIILTPLPLVYSFPENPIRFSVDKTHIAYVVI